MNKKSFIIGAVTGFVLAFIVLIVIGVWVQNSEKNDPIQYLDSPMSYENKKETSFKVLQVLGDKALAIESSDTIQDDVMYLGNTVLLLGDNFYNDQVVKVKNPQRVGTYNYTNNSGMQMTVPVISEEMK